MQEPQRLRKRSEAGKSNEASVPNLAAKLAATALVDGFPKGFAGAGIGTEEDIGAFASALVDCGFQVSLVEAAKWGTSGRNEVRKWLTTKNMKSLPAQLKSGKELAQNVLSDPAPASPATAQPEPKGKDIPMAKVDLPEAWGGPPEKPVTPPPPVAVSTEYERFIETVMREVDLDAEFDRLLPHLEVGEQRKDYAAVYEALDKAERRAFDANGLWINARMEYERLKLDQREVDAALYRLAFDTLEKAGKKTRIADVDAQIAEMYPDEWRSSKVRLKRAELAVERVESFAKLWSSKVASLRAMVDNVRR